MDSPPSLGVIRTRPDVLVNGAGERNLVQAMARSVDEVREAIFGFIAARNPGLPPGSVDGATSLVTSDALDSIGILDLMLHLGECYGVEIDEDAFELANFESVDTLARYVDDRRSGS